MKKNLLFFLIITISLPAISQKKFRSSDTTKYRINLPDYWKPGNIVWRILNDKLPTVCDELKDKDLCGDNCNAMYTVDFQMSEPLIVERYARRTSGSAYEFVTLYTFESSLLLRDRKDSILTRIILTDTNETYNVVQKEPFSEHGGIVGTQKLYLVKITERQAVFSTLNNSVGNSGINPASYYGSGLTPDQYMLKNKDKFNPTQRQMFDIIDRKIKALQD